MGLAIDRPCVFTTSTVPWLPLEQLTLPNAVPTSSHSNMKVSIPDDILSAKYVFVRHDSHRTPFQCPYDEPYEVILPGAKQFLSNSVIERKSIV